MDTVALEGIEYPVVSQPELVERAAANNPCAAVIRTREYGKVRGEIIDHARDPVKNDVLHNAVDAKAVCTNCRLVFSEGYLLQLAGVLDGLPNPIVMLRPQGNPAYRQKGLCPNCGAEESFFVYRPLRDHRRSRPDQLDQPQSGPMAQPATRSGEEPVIASGKAAPSDVIQEPQRTTPAASGDPRVEFAKTIHQTFQRLPTEAILALLARQLERLVLKAGTYPKVIADELKVPYLETVAALHMSERLWKHADRFILRSTWLSMTSHSGGIPDLGPLRRLPERWYAQKRYDLGEPFFRVGCLEMQLCVRDVYHSGRSINKSDAAQALADLSFPSPETVGELFERISREEGWLPIARTQPRWVGGTLLGFTETVERAYSGRPTIKSDAAQAPANLVFPSPDAVQDLAVFERTAEEKGWSPTARIQPPELGDLAVTVERALEIACGGARKPSVVPVPDDGRTASGGNETWQTHITKLVRLDGRIVSCTMSADGRHWSLVAVRPSGLNCWVDGSRLWTFEDSGRLEPDSVHQSPDARHTAFVVLRGGRSVLVIDGTEAREHDWIHPFTLAVGASGGKPKVAYFARDAGKWAAIIDGKAYGEYDYIEKGRYDLNRDDPRFVFSADRRVVIANGERGREWDEIGDLKADFATGHVAYAARREGKWFVVLDDHETEVAGEPKGLTVCAGGRGHLTYALKSKSESRIVVNGQGEPPLDELNQYQFWPSKDGLRYACIGKKGGEWWLIIDGETISKGEGIVSVDFSPDSRRFAYTMVQSPGEDLIVVEGAKPFTCRGGACRVWFGRDGKHYLVKIFAPPLRMDRSDSEAVVLDGRELVHFDIVRTPFVYLPDERITYLAEQDGNLVQVEHTLTAGEPLSVEQPKGVAELCEAARQGDLAATAGMLDREPAMVNARDSLGQTALHCAAGAGHKAVVELLIARGADVNVADNKRRTPLHLACANNHREIVTLLLSRGADLSATCDGGLQEGSPTPLQMAITRGQTEIAEVLINMGADVNRDFGPGLVCLRPLHVAAAMGNERLVTLLLDKGADITGGDITGRTALQLASMQGRVGVARLLRERGAAR